jgi:nitroreductase
MMEFAETLRARYSCRAYTGQPVALEQVERLVELAQRAPSWGNTQPWRAYAAGGEDALAIRRGLVEAHRSGQEPAPDIEMPAGFSGELMDRYRQLGRALFQVLDIGREDADKRRAHYENNFNAFGAPALVYVTVPADAGRYALFDAGAFTTCFCLAAADQGLGTCIIAALARYPQVVRRHLPIGENESLAIGLALGHPAEDAALNRFRSAREDLDQVLASRGLE